MSLQSSPIPPVPEATAAVARAAFHRPPLSLRLRDEFGALYEDADFAALFPTRGQPALPLDRLLARRNTRAGEGAHAYAHRQHARARGRPGAQSQGCTGPLALATVGAVGLMAGVVAMHGATARLLIDRTALALVAATLWNMRTRMAPSNHTGATPRRRGADGRAAGRHAWTVARARDRPGVRRRGRPPSTAPKPLARVRISAYRHMRARA